MTTSGLFSAWSAAKGNKMNVSGNQSRREFMRRLIGGAPATLLTGCEMANYSYRVLLRIELSESGRLHSGYSVFECQERYPSQILIESEDHFLGIDGEVACVDLDGGGAISSTFRCRGGWGGAGNEQSPVGDRWDPAISLYCAAKNTDPFEPIDKWLLRAFMSVPRHCASLPPSLMPAIVQFSDKYDSRSIQLFDPLDDSQNVKLIRISLSTTRQALTSDIANKLPFIKNPIDLPFTQGRYGDFRGLTVANLGYSDFVSRTKGSPKVYRGGPPIHQLDM